jgi:heparin/heparan-sulfate lyase
VYFCLLSHGQEATRFYAEQFVQDANGKRITHTNLKDHFGVSQIGNDTESPTVILKFDLDKPGRYVLSTYTLTDEYGDNLLKKAKTKYESLFMQIQVNNESKTHRVVCVPWNIPRQETGKFDLQVENEIKIWLPKGAILGYVDIKPYIPPTVPVAAQNYTPKYLPPAEHPRLWVTKESLPTVRANVDIGENKPKWEQIKTLASKDYNVNFEEDKEISFNTDLEKIAEAKAFYYLITQDKKIGLEAISLIKAYISRVEFGNILDITREIGQTIHITSEIYDWCYDIMKPEDKQVIYHHLMRLADDMEIGWPPFLQSIVNGHGNEAQINRDLLSLAIAVYNEDPLPYQYCAYAVLEELIPMRRFEYQSPRHNQGINYGAYRLAWDLHAAWLFKRMLNKEVFDPNIKTLGDYWIYSRLPDGQMLRDGDQSIAGKPGEYYYWQTSPISFFMNYTYSRNPYLKNSFEKTTNNHTVNPILYLLLNDPSFQSNKIPQDYPLTKDFGSILGGMINRTGWQDSLQSDNIVAEIKGGGYYFANHQHNDAGALQIYHKGFQVADLGLYQFYGTPYDLNFAKRSVSHSMMLAVDPNEKIGNLPSNDGGTRMYRTFPKNPEEVLSKKEFWNGTVLSSTFGPDKNRPKFNYFSVDLTSAYSDKIISYLRDYIFINTGRKDIPALIILKDQMETASPDTKKYWQANTLNIPTIERDKIMFSNSRGEHRALTYIDFIYPKPADREIRILSGDSTFNVFGFQVQPPMQNQAEGFGHRVLVSPTRSNTKDSFLAIFQMTNEGVTPMLVQHTKGSEWDYITIADMLILLREGEEPHAGKIKLELSDKKGKEIFVTGLREGMWQLTNHNGKKLQEIDVVKGQNILILDLKKKGKYFLKYTR